MVSIGNLVWAKITGHRFWPAVVIEPLDEAAPDLKCQKSTKTHYVKWFGDGSFSRVSTSKLHDFISHYDKFIKPVGNDAFRYAVQNAVKVLGDLLMSSDLGVNISKGKSMKISYDDAQKIKSIVNKSGVGVLQQEVDVSQSLLEQLYFFCTSQRTDCQEKPKRKCDKSIGNSKLINEESAKTSSCLVCKCEDDMLLLEHPMFKDFKICKSCVNFLLESFFSYSEKYETTNCPICLKEVALLDYTACSVLQCMRSFCNGCLQIFLVCNSESAWVCPLCQPLFYDKFQSKLKVDSLWKKNIMRLMYYDESNEESSLINPSYFVIKHGSDNSVHTIISLLDCKNLIMYVCSEECYKKLGPCCKSQNCSSLPDLMLLDFNILSTIPSINYVLSISNEIDDESVLQCFFSFQNVRKCCKERGISSLTSSSSCLNSLYWLIEFPENISDLCHNLISRHLEMFSGRWRNDSILRPKRKIWTNIPCLTKYICY